MRMIEIRDLDVRYGDGRDTVQAVRHATFSVAAGESFGLVGESGSGKSTILRAMTGLAPNWSGTIEIGGKPLTAGNRDREFYRQVQMVFQDPYASLHPRHTVDQVLSETLHLNGLGDIDQRVGKLLEDVGLGGKFRPSQP